MTWIYKNSVDFTIPDDAVGFVYLITNKLNNKKYIGKKMLWFKKTTYKTVTIKKTGLKKKKKIKSQVESDWKEYWSSSEILKEEVSKLGSDNFIREILHFCYTRAECSYVEAAEQFSRRVLETDEYYNGWISVKIHKSHIKKIHK